MPMETAALVTLTYGPVTHTHRHKHTRRHTNIDAHTHICTRAHTHTYTHTPRYQTAESSEFKSLSCGLLQNSLFHEPVHESKRGRGSR